MDAGADQDKNTPGTAQSIPESPWIGRATYDFKGKYLAEIVFRRDGSLKFPERRPLGQLPRIPCRMEGIGGRFLEKQPSVHQLLQTQGIVWQDGYGPGRSLPVHEQIRSLQSGMLFGTGTSIETVVGPPSVANPNITWETQTTQNIGFDSKWFNDLISLNLDLFFNKREDILTARDASVPNFTGLSLPSENIGRVDNKGFEIEAGFHKNLNSDLRIRYYR